MKFSIIGTGNMAWFLGKRLTEAGHTCAGVYGRNADKATELVNAIGGEVYPSQAAIKDDHELCLLAVSDDAVAAVAEQLSFNNTVLLHTAGSVPVHTLNNAARHNGVLWPVYSIIKEELPGHRDIPCIWESSDKEAEEVLFEVADAVTDMLFYADSEQRKWLHMAAVIGNNFTNHLMAICEQICQEQHLPFSILQPILQQTFERAAQASPYEKQTGPAKRADQTTMQGHHTLLASNAHWQQVYDALSTSIENMYRNIREEKGPMD